MRINFYSADENDDGENLGTWYTDQVRGHFPQVPRVGDVVWLETRDIVLTKFICKEVHWEFKNRPIVPGDRSFSSSVGAEVYIERVKKESLSGDGGDAK